MKLSSLEHLSSFALLGPGFGDGELQLLTDLSETKSDPTLAYASFECHGGSPQMYKAATKKMIELEFDSVRPAISVALETRGYAEHIETIREAIANGNVYQVCYARQAHLSPVTGSQLVTLFCQSGLPLFLSWVRLPSGEEFVSASPELFFETNKGNVHTEPMKGTARPDENGKLSSSEKDQAELAMITDLLRNDLTPVCKPRSVRVTCERRLVELPYALQTVSDISGELLPGKTPLDVLAALHPGGSVTGAPKRAALDFIGKLESAPRNAYCGALGLVNGEHSVFSLLIRTAQKTKNGWSYSVGSGIVYDSSPELELSELAIKLGLFERRAEAVHTNQGVQTKTSC